MINYNGLRKRNVRCTRYGGRNRSLHSRSDARFVPPAEPTHPSSQEGKNATGTVEQQLAAPTAQRVQQARERFASILFHNPNITIRNNDKHKKAELNNGKATLGCDYFI